MVSVINDPDDEAGVPTPRTSVSATPANDPANVTTTSDPVPFVPGDGSASSITAPADDPPLPLPSTLLRLPTHGFGLTPLSAARS